MKKVLVVVDMQNDFIDGALGSPEAEAVVGNVVAKINEYKAAGCKIYVTRDTHHTDYMNTREGRFLPVPHCIINSDGWQLNKEIEAAIDGADVTMINKPTFGAYALIQHILRDEQEALKTNEKISYELVGVCTDICVVSNALLIKATLPEADLFVDASCCAGVTPEKHEAALTTMQSCQIEITNH